jgi:putative membrane protein
MKPALPPGGTPADGSTEQFVFALERPLPALLTHYLIRCAPFLLFPPVGIALLLVHYFRYQTMRYRFDAEGISMRWGILFRRETILNYARIQDIHLVSGVIERWLGLARIQLQTASGSATPEMTLEGLPDHDRVRDFLYSRMRGTKDSAVRHPLAGQAQGPDALILPGTSAGVADVELAATLREVATELRGIREALERRPPA